MNWKHTTFVGCVAAVLVATGPAAAATTGPSFLVALNEDGSGDLMVTETYDLESNAEEQAFAAMRENETVRAVYEGRFRDRLERVAANTESRTGREMDVTNVSLTVSGIEETDSGTIGVVRRSATWHGLAAVDGDQLTISEPFASEFDIDRPFVIVTPEGYSADATPSPDSTSENRLTWNENTDLNGFELTASPEGGTLGIGPGFTAGAALVAIVAGALLGRRFG